MDEVDGVALIFKNQKLVFGHVYFRAEFLYYTLLELSTKKISICNYLELKSLLRSADYFNLLSPYGILGLLFSF